MQLAWTRELLTALHLNVHARSLGARVFRALFPQHSQLSELEELLPLVQVLHLQPAPESMDTGESIRLGLLPSLQGLELHGAGHVRALLV